MISTELARIGEDALLDATDTRIFDAITGEHRALAARIHLRGYDTVDPDGICYRFWCNLRRNWHTTTADDRPTMVGREVTAFVRGLRDNYDALVAVHETWQDTEGVGAVQAYVAQQSTWVTRLIRWAGDGAR